MNWIGRRPSAPASQPCRGTGRAHHRVQERVRGLHVARVPVEHDGGEQAHLLDGVVEVVDPDPVPDVVRVLHEQEDDAQEHLLAADADEPRQPCAARQLAPVAGLLGTHRV